MEKQYLVKIKVYDLDKIACIKHLRDVLCQGLREAKNMYEAFERGDVTFTAEELVDFLRFVVLSENNTVAAQWRHAVDSERAQNHSKLFQIELVDVADPIARYRELLKPMF